MMTLVLQRQKTAGMIERVARAMAKSQGYDWDEMRTVYSVKWDKEVVKDHWIDLAESAFVAAREPTTEMCAAAQPAFAVAGATPIACVWSFMIDAALGGK